VRQCVPAVAEAARQDRSNLSTVAAAGREWVPEELEPCHGHGHGRRLGRTMAGAAGEAPPGCAAPVLEASAADPAALEEVSATLTAAAPSCCWSAAAQTALAPTSSSLVVRAGLVEAETARPTGRVVEALWPATTTAEASVNRY